MNWKETRPAAPSMQALLVASGTAAVLSLVALMAAFLGSQSSDLAALNGALRIWCIVGAVGAVVAFRASREPGRSLLLAWWSRLPAWLVVLTAGLLILDALAVLAIVVIGRISGLTVAAGDVVPMLALAVACVAMLASWAALQPPGVSSGPRRHASPRRPY